MEYRNDGRCAQESYRLSGAQAVKAVEPPPSGEIGLTVSTNTMLGCVWMLLERQDLVKVFEKISLQKAYEYGLRAKGVSNWQDINI